MDTSLIIVILVGAAFVLFYLQKLKNSKNLLQPEAFKERLEEEPGRIIDVRTRNEYKNGHLKMTDYNFDVTSGEFEQKMTDLDKNETYYLYCRTGARSGQAVNMMKKEGFENVYNIGGLKNLLRAGFEKES